MTPTMFVMVFKAANARRSELLNAKSAEYARNGDKLSNFKKAAGMDGTTPEHALWGMNRKHIISITDMVNDLQYEGKMAPMDKWREKLDDLRNYCDLLEACLIERATNVDAQE